MSREMNKAMNREQIILSLRESFKDQPERQRQLVEDMEATEPPPHVKMVLMALGLTKEDAIDIVREAFNMPPRDVYAGSAESIEIEECQCPACKGKINAAFHSISNQPGREGKIMPKMGDVSVCFHCGAVLQFTSIEPMKYATADPAIINALSPGMRRAIAEIQSRIVMARAKNLQ